MGPILRVSTFHYFNQHFIYTVKQVKCVMLLYYILKFNIKTQCVYTTVAHQILCENWLKSSLIPPLLMEVPVSRQESAW
jgi:hypothetical protein